MIQEVKRNYLEINSLQDLKEATKPSEDYSLNLLEPTNFQLNKFFYKNIGKKHKWIDRLVWTETQWIIFYREEVNSSKTPLVLLWHKATASNVLSFSYNT